MRHIEGEAATSRGVASALVLAVTLGFMALALGHVAAQSPKNATKAWTHPKTPWGDPDLEGIWNPDGMRTPPMERPKGAQTAPFLTDQEIAALERAERDQFVTAIEEQKGPRSVAEVRNAPAFEKGIVGEEYNNFWMARPDRPRKVWNRPSLVIDPPDGRIPPLTPEAVKRIEAREAARRGRGEADSWEDRNLSERCINPATSILNGAKQILQAPGYVAITLDALNVTSSRLIPLDGRPHVGKVIRSWFGDPRGHWEGNTLIVETTNFYPKQDGGPILPSRRPFVQYLGSGETLRIVERFTRVSGDTIEYQYTVDDPSVYLKPYTVLRPLTRDDKYLATESACHEGNYGMKNLLTAGRANEAGALHAANEEARDRQPIVQEMKRRTAEALKK